MPQRICSIDGCELPHVARGWCSSHYQRFRAYGDPNAPVLRVRAYGDRCCSVDDCNEKIEARGLCNKHYLRLMKTGTVEWTSTTKREQAQPACIHNGCSNGSPRITGYCPTHQNRIDRYGSPDHQPKRFTPFYHLLSESCVAKVAARLNYDAPNGCWETQTKSPRQRVNLGNGVYIHAYRVMWAWHHGRDPHASIDHLCKNPRCCNPEHLEDVSDRINTLRYYGTDDVLESLD